MKIGIVGSHGVGKTTTALDLAQYIQKTGLYSVTVLTELARECPYPLGVNQPVEAAQWLVTRQMSRELELLKNSSCLICDRSAIDAMVYTLASGHVVEKDCLLVPAAKLWLDTYDLILWIRPDGKVSEDGFRMSDEVFRKEVDETFAPYLEGRDNVIELWQEAILPHEVRLKHFERILDKIAPSPLSSV